MSPLVHSGRRCAAAALLAAAWLLAAVPAAPAAEPAPTPVPTGAFVSWSHPNSIAPIRRHPNAGSPEIARVHLNTEGGAPEVYPILARFTDAAGRHWTRIAVPMRPNGRTGWVRSEVLGPATPTNMLLVVDRSALRATLTKAGRVIWTSRIGVGAPATPTPAGRFWIREKLRVTFGGMYGPRAFGTSDYSVLTDWPGGGVIGIHGTDQPGLIPGRPSHGCIRLRNAAVLRLFELMPVGTPMHVR